MANLDFLGTALKHPLEFQNGKPLYVSGIDCLRQSIRMILETQLGEVFMVRQFGSRLRETLFEPATSNIEGTLLFFTKDVLEKWEKRITFVSATFSYPSSSSIAVRLEYRVNGTDFTDTMVYPFYTQAGQ